MSDIIETPEFKSWFKESKVVDEDGSPLIVYHGTESDFNIFQHGKAYGSGDGEHGYFGKGFYFTNDFLTAESYGDSKDYYISLQNPYIDTVGKHSHPAHQFSFAKSLGVKPEEVRSLLEGKGYDGVIHYDKDGDNYMEVVAFYPEQIKLADGSNQKFDANNPDIRFKNGGMIKSSKMNYNSELTVLSFGGGQDSTAILYKLVEDPYWKEKYLAGKLIVIMANTGNEHPETYDHVDKMWNYCADNDIEFYLLGFEYTPASYKEGLVYHYERHNNIGSKAYPKTCTANLKITPIYMFLNEYIHVNFGTEKLTRKGAIKEFTETNGKINMIIGIAYGEESRVSEDNKDWNSWQGRIQRVYPLIEEKMDREACQKYIASTGNEVPIPSACIICPFMNDQELLYIYRFQRSWYDKWVRLEKDKIEAKGLPEDKSKALNSAGKIVDNLGVWGHKLLPEKLEEVLEKYGHMTDQEVRDYRFSHGHCVKNKM